MHEVSLVSALVEQVEGYAKERNFEQVLKIRLAVGMLSGVETECLEFCFSEVVKGTILQSATLVIESENILLQCKRCSRETVCEKPEVLLCQSCGSPHVRVKSGKDFRIVDLEVK